MTARPAVAGLYAIIERSFWIEPYEQGRRGEAEGGLTAGNACETFRT